MRFDDIEHITIGAEMTLCGYAIDMTADDDLVNEDEFQEKLEESKQDKTEYNSNCKICIEILKELKSIKK